MRSLIILLAMFFIIILPSKALAREAYLKKLFFRKRSSPVTRGTPWV